MTLHINVAKEFSTVPIGRFRTESDISGQAFREDILSPKICEAIKKQDTLEVDFTGMDGLSATFLLESFGGLVREHGMNPAPVLDTIKFLPEKTFFDLYIEIAKEFIQQANPGKEPEEFRA